MKFRLLLPLLLLGACSFKKSQLENQTQSGHTELYAEPEVSKKVENEDFKRVIIAGTNDLHGHYEPHLLAFKDRKQPDEQTIKIGGVDYISSYFKILRQQYGQILMLDAGDILSDKVQEMNYISDFYDILDYDAVTVGLSDFNAKLPAKYQTSSELFKDFSSKSKTPVILSNLYELKTARVVEWPGTLPYLMREVNGVKVGIIGLIPDDIVEQTPVDNRIGLYVENMLQSTLRHARLLRSLGAEIIVVMTHQGLNCGEELAQELKLPLSKVNFEPEKTDVCDLTNKMGQFITRLPRDLVDVVIGGRTHQKMANMVNGAVVMGNFGDGQSFSYAELYVDAKTKKLRKEKTVVHQPIMFCHEFFKETNDCYYEDTSVDHKIRVPAKFLGHEVLPDSSLELKFKDYLTTKVLKSSSPPVSVQPIMDHHEGNITYKARGSQNSKLILIHVTGTELSALLENDYNNGLSDNWKPSPYELDGDSLSLSVQGSTIEIAETYTILASLDDLQSHVELKKFIGRATNKSLNSVSWNEPGMDGDKVSTALSASETVR